MRIVFNITKEQVEKLINTLDKIGYRNVKQEMGDDPSIDISYGCNIGRTDEVANNLEDIFILAQQCEIVSLDDTALQSIIYHMDRAKEAAVKIIQLYKERKNG